MVEVELIRTSRLYLTVFYLAVFSLTLLFIVLLFPDPFDTAGLSPLVLQKLSTGAFFLFAICLRLLKSYEIIGKATLSKENCEFELDAETFKLPLSALDISIDGFEGEPYYGSGILSFHFWKSGDSNFIRFIHEGTTRRIAFKIDDISVKEKIIELNHYTQHQL